MDYINQYTSKIANFIHSSIGLIPKPLFGAMPRTHVANGSDDPILVKCVTDLENDIPIIELENSSYEDVKKMGFEIIEPGDYRAFMPPVGYLDGSWIHRATVYTTIYTIIAGFDKQVKTTKIGKLKNICINNPMRDNVSYIVKKDLQWVQTKMGTIWTDIQNEHHNPNSGQLIFPNEPPHKIYRDVNQDDFTDFQTIARGRYHICSARFKRNQKNVALKVLDKKINLNEKFKQEKHLSKITREGKIMRAANHENIIEFYGFFENDEEIILCMDLMKCSLKNMYIWMHSSEQSMNELSKSLWIDRQNPINIFEVLLGSAANSVLDALIYLYLKGIYHRDIKPDNILMDANGVIKLCDFGASSDRPGQDYKSNFEYSKDLLEEHMGNSITTSNIGTVLYWPPERCYINTYSYKDINDVWSLGITLLETALGKLPFNTDREKDISKVLNAIRTTTKEKFKESLSTKNYSDDANEFLLYCLEPDYEKRPTFDKLQEKNFYKNYQANKEKLRNILAKLMKLI